MKEVKQDLKYLIFFIILNFIPNQKVIFLIQLMMNQIKTASIVIFTSDFYGLTTDSLEHAL